VGNEPFLATYGDGVTNLNVGKVIEMHRQSGKIATVTAVRPPARFGSMVFDGNLVTRFEEKPQAGEGWISGGFFVLQPEVLDYIVGDATVWERDPMERLANEGQLNAYRHDGFWQCMDTLRDVRLLETLWQEGNAPWKRW
jgi:glucose-1-phosphate cytidylyltransferase